MPTRRNVLGLVMVSVVFGLSSFAWAAGATPFDQSSFEAAQAVGKPILVEVTAPWCPTCKAQAPTLARLKSDSRFAGLVAFNVDFDTQKDLLAKFSVQKQSTLIVFKGNQEVGRSTGVTDAGAIESLLAKAI